MKAVQLHGAMLSSHPPPVSLPAGGSNRASLQLATREFSLTKIWNESRSQWPICLKKKLIPALELRSLGMYARGGSRLLKTLALGQVSGNVPTATHHHPTIPTQPWDAAHPLGSHRCSAATCETGQEGRLHRQAASVPLSELQTMNSFSNIY